MLENENLVTEVAENVEKTTEETQPTVKTYTQEEVDDIVGKAKARTRAKVQKENDRKYGDLLETLRAGTGKEDVGEINDTFRDFYIKKGIEIKQKSNYSSADLDILAKADADEIIRGGYDEVVEEVDRLADIGAENMTAREKAAFKVLAQYRQSAERSRELEKIGVTEDVYNSKEFTDFASQFNPNVPMERIYNIYAQNQPKKEIKTAGSMKNTSATDDGVKDFYTPEEARRFTVDDFNRNPKLLERVEASMKKWRK